MKRSILLSAAILSSITVFASGDGGGHHPIGWTLFWTAVILLAARFAGLVEKLGQPAVLGELVIGVIIGNLYLLGTDVFEPIKFNSDLRTFSELGVIILLFQIGLESNINTMKKVGVSALLVAIIGVVVPFLLGTLVVGPLLLPELSFNTHLFVGAALTATSVGITARVFQDLKTLQTVEAQIVLGAAVIDDVLGLIILGVVTAIATSGNVGLDVIGIITAKALGFLLLAIVIGRVSAPYLGKFLSRINTGTGMKLTFAVSLGLLFAFFAEMVGLAPIVGAFAAGLVLDPVHFNSFEGQVIIDEVQDALKSDEKALKKIETIAHHHDHGHVEDLVKPLGFIFVPIFFVMTGMNVKLDTMFDPSVLVTALAITAVAIVGKIVSGLAAGKANKWIVGIGMIPRGEVGLIFAITGKTAGVINDELFSAIVVMVILTTLLTPPILAWVIKKNKSAA
jgi:Kef-type K+ transport system membrane component KefB